MHGYNKWTKLIVVVLLIGGLVAGCSAQASHIQSIFYSNVNDTNARDEVGFIAKQTIQDPFLVIAHRGASGYAPEHTMAAYRLAKKQQADYLEIDVNMTKDRRLVAIHDRTVQRTTNGKGAVKSLTLAQIQSLDAGSWFDKSFKNQHVPSVKEILRCFGKTINYYFEIKYPSLYDGMAEKLLALLQHHQLIGPDARPGDVIIESFSQHILEKIHEEYPHVLLVQLGYATNMTLSIINNYAYGVGPKFTMVSQAFVRRAHQLGLVVHPWTVNDKQNIKRLIHLQVDGIITNNPDRAIDVYHQMKGI